MFERFYQSEDSALLSSPGTGVGLALTKELITIMGGTISAQSQENSGTEFKVLLPVTQNAILKEINHETVYEDDSKESEFEFKISHFKADSPLLLIVEDNADIVAYISSILTEEYNLLIAQNGKEGITLATERIPDLVISDVMMPQLGGFEMAEMLKSDERTSHIPIILLTAKHTQQDKLSGLRTGADVYITKPFDKEELFLNIENLLENRRKLQTYFSGQKQVEAPAEFRDVFMDKFMKLIQNGMDDPKLSVKELCQETGLSRMQLNRKLKALTGESPANFIRNYRLNYATELLKNEELTIAEIAYKTGFSDPNYFSRAFSKKFGFPPGKIRK